MKKLLVFLISFCFVAGIVGAVSTTTYLQHTTDASAALSTEHSVSGNSARLSAWNLGVGNEGRVRVELPSDFTLKNLSSISWSQYVGQGYLSHVDVKINLNGGDIENGALVFEYAKVKEPFDATPYPSGELNTFDIRGIVDSDAIAWVSPGCAGGSLMQYATLGIWKSTGGKSGNLYNSCPSEVSTGTYNINENTRVFALEIEVDSWISEPTVFIDNVMVNGNLIQNFEGTQGAEGQISPDMTFFANPNPLNFGNLLPGQFNTVISTLSVGTSNLKVMSVVVNPTGDSIFNDVNVLFSLDNSLFVTADLIDPINIDAQTSDDLYVKLNVPIGTKSGMFEGTIVYTVAEQE